MKLLRAAKRFFYTKIASLRVRSVGEGLICLGYTRFSRNTQIATKCSFNGMIVYGAGNVEIGDNFHSGMGCKILTQSHNIMGSRLPYDDTYVLYDIKIARNVWFGMNVTVIGNVSIGEGAVIQVGSVVVSDVPPLAIVGGHPARVFAYRDKSHYERLSVQ